MGGDACSPRVWRRSCRESEHSWSFLQAQAGHSQPSRSHRGGVNPPPPPVPSPPRTPQFLTHPWACISPWGREGIWGRTQDGFSFHSNFLGRNLEMNENWLKQTQRRRVNLNPHRAHAGIDSASGHDMIFRFQGVQVYLKEAGGGDAEAGGMARTQPP